MKKALILVTLIITFCVGYEYRQVSNWHNYLSEWKQLKEEKVKILLMDEPSSNEESDRKNRRLAELEIKAHQIGGRMSYIRNQSLILGFLCTISEGTIATAPQKL